MEPVIMPIEDVLDLHTFNPKEVGDLLDDYFSACVDKGIFSVRLIHGKGQGILKKRVHTILKRHALVISYQEATPDAGGWGATFVVLRRTP